MSCGNSLTGSSLPTSGLWIPEPDNYTYPDVMVVEGELTYKPGRKDTITNPILIMEVLSASTRTYDRGDKFVFYRTIPSFRNMCW